MRACARRIVCRGDASLRGRQAYTIPCVLVVFLRATPPHDAALLPRLRMRRRGASLQRAGNADSFNRNA
jgi:hypothetical protein